MCTEFILAFLYFNTILIINYFLFLFLKKTNEKIFYFFKIEKILKNLQKIDKQILFCFFFQLKKKGNFLNIAHFLNQSIKINDLLIVSYSSNFLLMNMKVFLKEKERNISKKIYLNLLKQQYLFQTEKEINSV